VAQHQVNGHACRMRAPLLLAGFVLFTCQPHDVGGAEAEPLRWVTDANGCKFLSPAPPEAPSFTITWTGQCLDGFVSGPGEVRVGSWLAYRGEFSQGRIVKGSAEKNGAVYEGSFLDNLPHGHGVSREPDGATTKGTWARGVVDPTSVEHTWPNNTRYRGEIDPRTKLMHGKGVIEYADGSVYEGEFSQDQLQGLGVMKYASGEIRRGTFVAGQMEGKGSILYSNHSRYEGELRAGSPNGTGRMEFADGSSYEGEFVSGKYQGKGKLTYTGGGTYEGDFLAGETSGNGALHYADGSHYVGQFLYGRRHGNGLLTRPTGQTYQGEWKGDVLSGKCNIAFGLRVYDGQCVDGKASGPGRLEDKDLNLAYEGAFIHDQFHGKGSLRIGKLAYEGMFRGGAMEGPGTLTVGNMTVRGDFKAGVLARGTITGNDGRTFEVDIEKGEIVEVLKDGSKRPIDELPADMAI